MSKRLLLKLSPRPRHRGKGLGSCLQGEKKNQHKIILGFSTFLFPLLDRCSLVRGEDCIFQTNGAHESHSCHSGVLSVWGS